MMGGKAQFSNEIDTNNTFEIKQAPLLLLLNYSIDLDFRIKKEDAIYIAGIILSYKKCHYSFHSVPHASYSYIIRRLF